MSEAVAQLLGHGVLGVICVILMGVCYRLWGTTQRLHKERIDDAKTSSKEVLESNTKLVSALTSNTEALHAAKEASLESRQAFKELADDIRNRFIRRT